MRIIVKKHLLLFTLILFMGFTQVGWGQTTIHSNDCSTATTNWTFTNNGGVVIQQSGYWLVDFATDVIVSETFNVSSYTNLTLTFQVATYGSGTNHSCLVEYSTDAGSTWSATTFTSATPTSSTYISAGTWNMGTISTTQLKLRWTSPSGGSKGVRIDNISFQGTLVSSNSTASDIVVYSGYTYPTNIDYKSYQSTNIIADANDMEVAKFTIRDGGATTDVDVLGTTLTSIQFAVTNSSNIRRIALYDGVTEVGTEVAGASTVTFSGFNLLATDGSTKDFSIRVSFNSTVTDNQNIQFTISSATADIAGSTFASANAGAATTDNTGNNNKIVVTATQLVYTPSKPPTSVFVDAGFNVEVKAKDANSNTDLDATNSVTLTRSTGTGVLSSTTGLTQSLSAGVYSWTDVAYNTVESFAITATASGLTDAVSSSITCQSVPVATHVVIAEIYAGGGNSGAPYTNDYIVLYNPTGSAVDLSTWSVQYTSATGTFSTSATNYSNLSGSISANGYYLIQAAAGSTPSADLPVTPNVTCSIAMGATAGKVALVNDQNAISNESDLNVIDFVGYGSTANEFEGTASTSAPSNTSSVRRKSNTGTNTYGSGNGCDSDDNAFDFYVETDLITNAPLPVELTSFSASAQNKTVNLTWKTATEVNNFGFEVERVKDFGDKVSMVSVWQKVGFVYGAGNSNSPKEYSFTDKSAVSGKYLYRLKQLDNDGQYTYSKEVQVDLGTPTAFALEQNYPNPFNPSTSIQYSVVGSQYVSLKVFNVLGKEVAVLVNEKQEPGTYTVEFSTANLASGTYIYRMQAGEFVQTKKMVILK
jgi:hypothetical protein